MLKVTIGDIFGNVATVYADTLNEALKLAETHPNLCANSDLGTYLQIIYWK